MPPFKNFLREKWATLEHLGDARITFAINEVKSTTAIAV